jgi:hypothetical protein
MSALISRHRKCDGSRAITCAHHQGAVYIQDPFEGGGQRSAHGGANSKQAWVLALLCGPSGATIATVTRHALVRDLAAGGFIAQQRNIVQVA